VSVEVVDPLANHEEVAHEYGFKLTGKPTGKYNAIILAVNHDDYAKWTEKDFVKHSYDTALLYDVKGVMRNKIRNLKYLSL
jgi:UDP-N-acetyl-D-galactosamine dehydrogenase